MNILFVCKYNRFRSKIAEAYFKKVNKDKTLKAKSAGVIEGNPISPGIRAVAKRNDLTITGKPRHLSVPLLRWMDVVIIVADDVPKSIFSASKDHGKKVILWRIPDCNETETKKADRAVEAIKNKIDRFLAPE